MFRAVNHKKRGLTEDEAKAIFKRCDWGVLSVAGDCGYPYGVPINYGYDGEKFYIHCTTRMSHKVDAIRKNDKVCLTAVSRHTMIPEKFTTDYQSAIAFGRARIIEDDAEKRAAMEKMMVTLAPEYAKDAMGHCGGKTEGFLMIEVTPELLTGKERR